MIATILELSEHDLRLRPRVMLPDGYISRGLGPLRLADPRDRGPDVLTN